MNLTLCYYAVSDREKLKRCFCRMLQISSGADDEDRYFPTMVSIHVGLRCLHGKVDATIYVCVHVVLVLGAWSMATRTMAAI